VEIYLHYPNTLSWCGAQFKKEHGNNYTFTFKMSSNSTFDLHGPVPQSQNRGLIHGAANDEAVKQFTLGGFMKRVRVKESHAS
jgi:hypothetical protein